MLAQMWRTYLRLGRVSNLPTVWTNCIAGLVLAGAEPQLALLLPSALAASFLYTGGMFLNDAFDVKFDKNFRPERPIPSGEISVKTVYAIGFLLLAAGVILFRNLAAGILALLIVYYDYRHKRDPISPVIMSLCRFMVYFAAAAVAGQAFSAGIARGAVVLACYVIGLSYVAKQENLSEIKNLWPLVLLAAPLLNGARVLVNWNAGTLTWLILLGVIAYSLRSIAGAKRNIPRAVSMLIAGIALVDGIAIAGGAPGIWSWICAGAFLLTLALQRHVPGT
jgi:4-hydroxybenzoate polyprenyltransferase